MESSEFGECARGLGVGSYVCYRQAKGRINEWIYEIWWGRAYFFYLSVVGRRLKICQLGVRWKRLDYFLSFSFLFSFFLTRLTKAAGTVWV